MPAEDAVEQTAESRNPDTKDKFRAALERKRNQQHANNGVAQNESTLMSPRSTPR